MKRLWLPLLLVLSLGLNAGLLWTGFVHRETRAEERRRGAHEERRPREIHADSVLARRLRFVGERVDLDAAERARLAEVIRGFVPEIVIRRRQLDEARAGLFAGTAEGTVDRAAVLERVAAVSRAQAQLDSLVAESMLEEMAVLAPEKRVRFLESLRRDPWPGRRHR